MSVRETGQRAHCLRGLAILHPIVRIDGTHTVEVGSGIVREISKQVHSALLERKEFEGQQTRASCYKVVRDGHFAVCWERS